MITVASEDRILTNQLLLDELDLWFELDSKSITDEDAKKFYQKLSYLIDNDIDAAIKWLESEEAQEIFFSQSEAQKEIFDALETEWDTILNQSYDSVDELLDEIYETGKKKGYENIRETLRYTDADIQAIRIAKDYNFHLIRKLDNDLRGTVKNKILQGIISGENPYNLGRTLAKAGVQQLEGSTFTPRQRATMIAKTETSRMQNTGMLQSYINEGYTEVKILTAEDSNVCTTCLEYAYKFNKDEPRVFSPELLEREKVHDIVKLIKGGLFPPFHPNCRCTYLTVWGSKTEPPENPYVIDLTPENFNSLEYLERLKSLEGWKLLENKDVPDHIPTTLKNNMLSFEKQNNKFEDGNEWAQVCNLTTGEIYEIMSDGNSEHVAPFREKDYGTDEMAMVHNHQDGTFLSPSDFTSAFFNNNNIKYVAVHTDNYIFIAKFIGVPSNEEELNQFLDEYNKIRASSSPDSCWNKFNSNSITRKYVSVDMVVKV